MTWLTQERSFMGLAIILALTLTLVDCAGIRHAVRNQQIREACEERVSRGSREVCPKRPESNCVHVHSDYTRPGPAQHVRVCR